MREVFYVFIGGGIGSTLRFFTGKFFSSFIPTFPIGTLFSNVISTFILGLVFGLFSLKNINNNSYLFLATGICGGFSTYSTFTLESMNLIQSGNVSYGLINIGLNLILCFLSLAIGIAISKQF